MKLHVHFMFLLLFFGCFMNCVCLNLSKYTEFRLTALERFVGEYRTRIHVSSTNRTFEAETSELGSPLAAVFKGEMVGGWDDGQACHDLNSLENRTAISGSDESVGLYVGKIILVRGGNCSDVEKIIRIQNVGGILAILADDNVDLQLASGTSGTLELVHDTYVHRQNFSDKYPVNICLSSILFWATCSCATSSHQNINRNIVCTRSTPARRSVPSFARFHISAYIPDRQFPLKHTPNYAG